MTKKEMLEAMNIEATPKRLALPKSRIERFFDYYMTQKHDKEQARRFILQFLPR